jgi:hypothetical protein
METIRKAARGLLSLARGVDLRDLFVFGGLAMVVCGVAQINVPAAWITAGGVLFLLGMKR